MGIQQYFLVQGYPITLESFTKNTVTYCLLIVGLNEIDIFFVVSRLPSSTVVCVVTLTSWTPARSPLSRRSSPNTSRPATRACWPPSPRTARSPPNLTPHWRRLSLTSSVPSLKLRQLKKASSVYKLWRWQETHAFRTNHLKQLPGSPVSCQTPQYFAGGLWKHF